MKEHCLATNIENFNFTGKLEEDDDAAFFMYENHQRMRLDALIATE